MESSRPFILLGVIICLFSLATTPGSTLSLSFILSTSARAQLQSACKHNEFRCEDGSGCLSTEKLCNGVEDCRNGEDEKGNNQWDCTRSTLQTECNIKELKCRLGGCIPISKKCDGVPDCWGGNDEAIDLCNVKPGRRPRPPMTTKTPPNKTVIFPGNFQYPKFQLSLNPLPSIQAALNPLPALKVSFNSQQLFPQFAQRPVEATSTIRTTSTSKPKDIPTPPPYEPPPPSPPALQPQPPVVWSPHPPLQPSESIHSTELPSNILTANRINPNPHSNPNNKLKGCPPLEKEPGVEIECYIARWAKTFNCHNRRSPISTEATYRCSKYYGSPKTGPVNTKRTCGADGVWTKKNNNWRCNLKCGIEGFKPVGFIVGGQTATPNRWPWHVALYNEDPPNSGKYVQFCGGTLISRRAVLTAAHCATIKRTTKKREDPVIAIPGKYHRTFDNNDESDSYAQRRRVVDISVNEYYNHINYEADIAIMWLDEDVEITEGVRPICLPHKNDDVQPGFEDVNRGVLAGWGRSDGREFPEDLQEADLPVVDIQTCKRAHPTLALLVRTTTFCAGYTNGTTACDGDSGGGLVFEHPIERGKWFVKGVVSAGVSRRGGGCNEHFYTVFTKVPQYRDWIDSLIS